MSEPLDFYLNLKCKRLLILAYTLPFKTTSHSKVFIPSSTVSFQSTGALLYQVIKLVFFHIIRYTNGDIVVIKQYSDFLKMPLLLDHYCHCSALTPSGFSLYRQHDDKNVLSGIKEDLKSLKYSQNLTHDYQL